MSSNQNISFQAGQAKGQTQVILNYSNYNIITRADPKLLGLKKTFGLIKQIIFLNLETFLLIKM